MLLPGAQARTAVPRTSARGSESSFCNAARTVALARCSCATLTSPELPALADLDERRRQQLRRTSLRATRAREPGRRVARVRRRRSRTVASTIPSRNSSTVRATWLAGAEQRRRLADPVTLVRAAPSATRRARRRARCSAAGPRRPFGMQNGVALLPLADRVGRDAGALRQRCDVEARDHDRLLYTSLPAHATLGNVPEGDTLHRAARRLQVLVGQRIEVESPHPRAQAERVAERIDGRRARIGRGASARTSCFASRAASSCVRTCACRAAGRCGRAGEPRAGQAVARAARRAGRGRALERAGARAAHARARAARAGHPRRAAATSTRCSRGCARADQTRWLGETLLDQTLVAGIGNMWLAEVLWEAELSPWRRLRRRHRGRAARVRSRRRPADARVASTGGRGAAGRSTAAPAGRARAAGRRSARGGRATTTGWPTGVPTLPGRRRSARARS